MKAALLLLLTLLLSLAPARAATTALSGLPSTATVGANDDIILNATNSGAATWTTKRARAAAFMGSLGIVTNNASNVTLAGTFTGKGPDGSALATSNTTANAISALPFSFYVSINSYGAIGDSVQLSNVTMSAQTLTCSSANFTTNDVGKSIQVVDALGTGVTLSSIITQWVSSTVVTLSNAATATPMGQAFYGHNNAPAVQAAVNSLTNGGCLIAQEGSYLLDDPWHALPNSVGGFAQIVLPYRAFNQTNLCFKIQGPRTPQHTAPQFNALGSIASVGAIFVCARSAPDTTNYTIIGWPNKTLDTWGFNYVRLDLEDVVFRTQRDGRLCPLQLRWLSQAQLHNVIVDVGVVGLDRTNAAPRYASYGLIMPGVNNNVQSKLAGVWVDGFGTGMSLGECSSADLILASLCPTAFEVNPSWHAMNVGYSLSLWCPTNISAGSYSPANATTMELNWGMADSESTSLAGWYNVNWDCYDDASIFYGHINFHSASSGAPRIPTIWKANNLDWLAGGAHGGRFLNVNLFDTPNHYAVWLGYGMGNTKPTMDLPSAVPYACLLQETDTGNFDISTHGGKINFYSSFATLLGSVSTSGFSVGSTPGITATKTIYTRNAGNTGPVTNSITITGGLITDWTQTQ